MQVSPGTLSRVKDLFLWSLIPGTVGELSQFNNRMFCGMWEGLGGLCVSEGCIKSLGGHTGSLIVNKLFKLMLGGACQTCLPDKEWALHKKYCSSQGGFSLHAPAWTVTNRAGFRGTIKTPQMRKTVTTHATKHDWQDEIVWKMLNASCALLVLWSHAWCFLWMMH